MITSVDKALVAIVMGALYIVNSMWGINIGLNEEAVSALIGLATPLLVWWWPNKA